LEVRLCMSPRLWGKVFRPLEISPCPGSSPGGIVATLSISLVVQISRRFLAFLSA
jgi:hypothetical protein